MFTIWRNRLGGYELNSKESANNLTLNDRWRGTSIERHAVNYPTYAVKALRELETQSVETLNWVQSCMLVRVQSLQRASKCVCMYMCMATGHVIVYSLSTDCTIGAY